MTRTAEVRMPAVAHLLGCYLGRTETFIHDYLAAFRRIRPVIIARTLENLELFPPPPGASLIRSPPRRGTPAWALSAVRRRLGGGDAHLRAILHREGVRLMHAHFGPTACELLDVVRRTRLPLVTSFYGYDASVRDVLEEYADRYRRLFDLGSAFLVEGSTMKRKLEALGCASSRIRVVRIGIDPGRYRFRVRSDPAGGAVVLLQCGRMVPKKGYATTLESFALARAKDSRLRLRIIGDGPRREAIEARIEKLGLRDDVTLLGACTRERFLDELGRAHIYLQPSRVAPDGDSEGGAPTTLLEAQACGLPILATRHADIPEIVRPMQSALLSEERDVGSLAANIEHLASRPDLWASMGRAGRAHVEEHHDVHRWATRLEILYAHVASRGEPPP